jgi:hypothetical protein
MNAATKPTVTPLARHSTVEDDWAEAASAHPHLLEGTGIATGIDMAKLLAAQRDQPTDRTAAGQPRGIGVECKGVGRRSTVIASDRMLTLHGVVFDILDSKGGHGARAPLPTLRDELYRPPSGPITRFGSPVEISGTKHSTTTATIISSTNGSVPQITSLSGISGATLRMTKMFRPTGG